MGFLTSMTVLYVGNFQGPGNSSGEEADERHQARCLQQAGVKVITVPRDEVHAAFVGAKKDNLPPPQKVDFIVIAKWNHYTGPMIDMLRERYQGKVVYFCWDFMFAPHRNFWTPDFHIAMMKTSDYYVSGELGMADWFKKEGINYRYFNWDSSDGQYDVLPRSEEYDIVFTGTYIGHSYRNNLLREVAKRFKLKVFSWDADVWRKEGFDAEVGKYGADFNQISAKAKVMLCMNWVEPKLESAGYQSNRIGKILTTGGMPLVHYFPMAERLLSDRVLFFHDQGDMFNKIEWLLSNPAQRETARIKAYDFGRQFYTTQIRMAQFKILLESFYA